MFPPSVVHVIQRQRVGESINDNVPEREREKRRLYKTADSVTKFFSTRRVLKEFGIQKRIWIGDHPQTEGSRPAVLSQEAKSDRHEPRIG